MARPFVGLGVLVSGVIAGLILTTAPALAQDRYGSADGGYVVRDGGYASQDEREAVDPYVVQDRVMDSARRDDRDSERSDRVRDDGDARTSERRVVRVYRGDSDVEAIDPYARQERVIRRDRGYDDGRYVRSERVYEEDRGYGRSGFVTERDDFDGGGYARVIRSYPQGDVWRTREVYGYGAGACGACNVRYVEPCMQACGYVRTESLPEDFFISEGGVGPGIVDFGGSGGGGFVSEEGFASANASASASANLRLKFAVMGHNHMHHFPHGHGCGCGGKKW